MSNATKHIADQRQRDAAVDVRRSFIVQAPAGSGKTELLTQRYLNLLGQVEYPENILAITFTRKAANEMRQRIIGAIEFARDNSRPEEPHRQRSWDFASAVLQRDAAQGWRLLENPARLRVSTIDSLCHDLTRQLPLLSELGGGVNIADDCQALYQQAAQQAIESGLVEGDAQQSLAKVLNYLGNNVARLESVLANMLAKRDQWGRPLIGFQHARYSAAHMEQGLRVLIDAELAYIDEFFSAELKQQLWPLLQFAAGNLREKEGYQEAYQESHWPNIDSVERFPDASTDHYGAWCCVADLLLTNGGTWRKRLDKNIGFPAGKYQEKEVLNSILEAAEGDIAMQNAIAKIKALPEPSFSEDLQAICSALIDVLVLGLQHLNLVFAQSGQVDHAEVLLRALRALGDDDQPTDLALRLDYQIQHVLADEVQDTSHSQFELLRKLTLGWQPSDGRTLFAVGDPMQSIYSFREADVGLYLHAWQHGIGDFPLEQLRLTVNFRSQAGLVDWFNQSFKQILPAKSLAEDGAVSYSPADEFHPDSGNAVAIHAAVNGNAAEEAAKVLGIVQQRLKEFANTAPQNDSDKRRIAILVRGRSHLAETVLALNAANIPFRAVEIETLSAMPVIDDLRNLTRALLHPADRVAWLAVLRAPFCGLSVRELHTIAGDWPFEQRHYPLWPVIERAASESNAPPRLQRFVSAISQALKNLSTTDLAHSVEQAWRAMGGAVCLQASASAAEEAEAAELFFSVLRQLETQQGQRGGLHDFAALDQALEKLFAPAQSGEVRVELMTMHKSKGLQFDTVILPSLQKGTGSDSAPPLHWLEVGTDNQEQLVMAPFPAAGDSAGASKLYSYIAAKRQQRLHNEQARLLYVAATRAEQRLHLLGNVTQRSEEHEPAQPKKASLLHSLWSVAEAAFAKQAYRDKVVEEDGEYPTENKLQRLSEKISVAAPQNPLNLVLQAPQRDDPEYSVYQWQSPTQRHIGTVVHAALERFSLQSSEEFLQSVDETKLESAAKAQLSQLGVPSKDLSWATARVLKAIRNTLNDADGLWLLGLQAQQAHQMPAQAESEWALAAVNSDGLVNTRVIDRSFIADGKRWILDYKTSVPAKGQSIEAFASGQQARYREQLMAYAELFRESPEPIKLALYFPLVPHLHTWDDE